MKNIHVEFEINKFTFLLGIDYSDCIAEYIKTEEQYESKTLSLGFLFFTIHFNFYPERL